MERCAGTARKAFNWGLGRWQEMYKAGDKPSWQKLNAELNAIKVVEFPWMTELPWKVTNGALADLGNAFQNFFRRVKAGDRKVGYPKFKKKGRCKEAFAIDGRKIIFDGKKIRVPKLGWIRLREPLRFPGKVLGVRFLKHVDHWYVSVQVEIDESRWSYPHRCETQAVVGVDLGVVDLAVLSDGTKIEAPRSLRIHEKRLRMLQKELSRRTLGGSNWRKTKLKVGKLYERITNVRKDVTHKLTVGLVRDFRWIGIEDLNVKGMAKNSRLTKSVLDAAMAEVSRQLAYKAPLAGSTVVVADRWYPSSKTCSDCGHVVKDLPLGIRGWACDVCGVVHDRDVNAAINLKNLAEAHSVTACRQGSSGLDPMVGMKLPLGQESGSVANLG
jgi:putative transposase